MKFIDSQGSIGMNIGTWYDWYYLFLIRGVTRGIQAGLDPFEIEICMRKNLNPSQKFKHGWD